MSAYTSLYLNPILPWEASEEESKRFRKILIGILLFCLIFGIVIPLIDVPKDVRVINKVPDRLVKLVIEQKKVVQPPPPTPELPKEEEKPEEKKEEPKPEEKKPEPKEPPKVPNKKSAKQAAEEKAAVFDVFADLRDNTSVNQLTEVTELTKAGDTAVENRREVIGNSALKDTGGINVAVASSSKGGGGTLEGTGTTAVTSKIQGVTRKAETASKGGAGGARSSENIQLTFDRNIGTIFTAYNRALRKNPALKGVVVFKLVIQPSGKVSDISVVSSELGDEALEKRLMSAIKRLDFGAMDVATWTGNYPVVFTPQ